MTQPALFDLDLAGGCATCGRPADTDDRMPFEPVSGECLQCNHATIREMYRGPDREAAIRRHYRTLGRQRPAVVDRIVARATRR